MRELLPGYKKPKISRSNLNLNLMIADFALEVPEASGSKVPLNCVGALPNQTLKLKKTASQPLNLHSLGLSKSLVAKEDLVKKKSNFFF